MVSQLVNLNIGVDTKVTHLRNLKKQLVSLGLVRFCSLVVDINNVRVGKDGFCEFRLVQTQLIRTLRPGEGVLPDKFIISSSKIQVGGAGLYSFKKVNVTSSQIRVGGFWVVTLSLNKDSIIVRDK